MSDQKPGELVVGGIYRHFKGNHYQVIGFGRHTENGQELIAYRSMKETIPFRLWFRPPEIFLGLNEQGVRRFELVSDDWRKWCLSEGLKAAPLTMPA